MENQHRKISGYRELDQSEIDLMNGVKEFGKSFGSLVDRLRQHENTDKRWVSIGATEAQQALMALTRSIARPDFF